jgi:hypothetical protein
VGGGWDCEQGVVLGVSRRVEGNEEGESEDSEERVEV